MCSRRQPRPSAEFDVRAFRALLARVVAGARPDDQSEGVVTARGILDRTCAICGDDLDDIGRRDPARLCPACRPSSPPVA